MSPSSPSARGPDAPGLYQLLQLGVNCGVWIGLGVLGGYLLDRALGTSPLLVFIGLAVGILGAGVGCYYLIKPYLSRPQVNDASSEASRAKE